MQMNSSTNSIASTVCPTKRILIQRPVLPGRSNRATNYYSLGHRMGASNWFAFVRVVGWLLILGLPGPEVPAQQSRPDNEITKLADDVYLFRHQFHQAIFITTSQGVIVADPISAEAATWLKTEIKKLTDQPVRYVVYSHHHNDHITGGSVFAGQAIFVSHAAARVNILQAADPTTPVPDLTFTDRLF